VPLSASASDLFTPHSLLSPLSSLLSGRPCIHRPRRTRGPTLPLVPLSPPLRGTCHMARSAVNHSSLTGRGGLSPPRPPPPRPPKLVMKQSSNFLSMQNARHEQKGVAPPCYRYNYGDADRMLPRPLLAGLSRLERYFALFNFLYKCWRTPRRYSRTCVPATRYDSPLITRKFADSVAEQEQQSVRL